MSLINYVEQNLSATSGQPPFDLGGVIRSRNEENAGIDTRCNLVPKYLQRLLVDLDRRIQTDSSRFCMSNNKQPTNPMLL